MKTALVTTILCLGLPALYNFAHGKYFDIKGNFVSKKSKPSKNFPKRRRHSQRVINVHATAFEDAKDWCRTNGGLKYIQVDPNKGGLYRYVCQYNRN